MAGAVGAELAPDTRHLTLWLQVVGKTRIARTPLLNHWWKAPLYLTSRGLTTSLMPGETGRSFSIDLDPLDHRLDVTTTRAESRRMDPAPKSVKDFYTELTELLDAWAWSPRSGPCRSNCPGAIPFPDDTTHSSYDPTAVTPFWRILVEARRVFNVSGPAGSGSPALSTSSG